VEEIVLQGEAVAGVRTGGLLEAEVVVNAPAAGPRISPAAADHPLRSLAVITDRPLRCRRSPSGGAGLKIVYGCTQTKRATCWWAAPGVRRHGRAVREEVSLREMLVNASVIPRMFPQLACLSVIGPGRERWGSPDGLPCVGWVPPYKGLYVAAGYSNGMSWAPVTSRLLAELIVEGDTSIALDHLDPRRFAGKSYSWPRAYDYTVLAEYLGRAG
jgi:glycine/D-amino acid oxidase-like deaminating enzyme